MAEKLVDQISYLVAGASSRVEQQIRAAAGPSHMPTEQWRILALLTEQEGRTMSDLAHHAFLEAPTLTKMIDRMVADALVYRVPDSLDRRRILIFVSDRGRARHARLQAVIVAYEDRMVRYLGRRGAAALMRLCREIADADLVDCGDLTDQHADAPPARPVAREAAPHGPQDGPEGA